MDGGGVFGSIGARGLLAGLLLACASLGGCATGSYAGIPLKAGAADPELQALARRAQAGDKHAQLELGIRYEEGRGVPVGLSQAEGLYRLAATAGERRQHVYVPPVGVHGQGRVISIDGGRRSGLASAAARLQALISRSSCSWKCQTNPKSNNDGTYEK